MNAPDPGLRTRNAKWRVRSFTSISIQSYVSLQAASNPGTNVKELVQQLQQLLKAKQAGRSVSAVKQFGPSGPCRSA